MALMLKSSVQIAGHQYFDYHKTMEVFSSDPPMSAVAAAIAEPARTRMLYCLMDGRARTSTELAIVAQVSPSTASVHLARLRERHLVKVLNQGKCRYYSLESPQVAAALEALTVIAGEPRGRYVPRTPVELREARSCYDHLAGALGVALHQRLLDLGWFLEGSDQGAYELAPAGSESFAELGLDVEALRAAPRGFSARSARGARRR